MSKKPDENGSDSKVPEHSILGSPNGDDGKGSELGRAMEVFKRRREAGAGPADTREVRDAVERAVEPVLPPNPGRKGTLFGWKADGDLDRDGAPPATTKAPEVAEDLDDIILAASKRRGARRSSEDLTAQVIIDSGTGSQPADSSGYGNDDETRRIKVDPHGLSASGEQVDHIETDSSEADAPDNSDEIELSPDDLESVDSDEMELSDSDLEPVNSDETDFSSVGLDEADTDDIPVIEEEPEEEDRKLPSDLFDASEIEPADPPEPIALAGRPTAVMPTSRARVLQRASGEEAPDLEATLEIDMSAEPSSEGVGRDDDTPVAVVSEAVLSDSANEAIRPTVEGLLGLLQEDDPRAFELMELHFSPEHLAEHLRGEMTSIFRQRLEAGKPSAIQLYHFGDLGVKLKWAEAEWFRKELFRGILGSCKQRDVETLIAFDSEFARPNGIDLFQDKRLARVITMLCAGSLDGVSKQLFDHFPIVVSPDPEKDQPEGLTSDEEYILELLRAGDAKSALRAAESPEMQKGEPPEVFKTAFRDAVKEGYKYCLLSGEWEKAKKFDDIVVSDGVLEEAVKEACIQTLYDGDLDRAVTIRDRFGADLSFESHLGDIREVFAYWLEHRNTDAARILYDEFCHGIGFCDIVQEIFGRQLDDGNKLAVSNVRRAFGSVFALDGEEEPSALVGIVGLTAEENVFLGLLRDGKADEALALKDRMSLSGSVHYIKECYDSIRQGFKRCLLEENWRKAKIFRDELGSELDLTDEVKDACIAALLGELADDLSSGISADGYPSTSLHHALKIYDEFAQDREISFATDGATMKLIFSQYLRLNPQVASLLELKFCKGIDLHAEVRSAYSELCNLGENEKATDLLGWFGNASSLADLPDREVGAAPRPDGSHSTLRGMGADLITPPDSDLQGPSLGSLVDDELKPFPKIATDETLPAAASMQVPPDRVIVNTDTGETNERIASLTLTLISHLEAGNLANVLRVESELARYSTDKLSNLNGYHEAVKEGYFRNLARGDFKQAQKFRKRYGEDMNFYSEIRRAYLYCDENGLNTIARKILRKFRKEIRRAA